MKRLIFNCLVVAALAISAAFASSNESAITKLPEVITKSDGSNTMYEYDSQNRIAKILLYNDGEHILTQTFTYSGSNLVKILSENPELDEPTTEEFTKTGNQIFITYNFGDYGEGDGVLEINDDGYPINFSGSDGHNLGFSYDYTIRNGNVLKVTTEQHRFGGAHHILNFDVNYRYDDKKSPFTHCTTPEWWMIICMWGGKKSVGDEYGGKNNVIEENWKGILNDVEENRKEDYSGKKEYTYEYDNEDFPTQCTVKHSDGTVDVYTFKYK